MVEIKLSTCRREIWFVDSIKWYDFVCLVNFKQSHFKIPFFCNEIFYTKILNLTQDINFIFNTFSKNTKYEIKRAERESVLFEKEDDMDLFIEFYNIFAEFHNLNKLSLIKFSHYKENIIITKALYLGKVVAMHCYIFDNSIGRVRLLYSASHMFNQDSKYRALIGRANRFLHFKDIIYFKNNGFKEYDMGGYAYNTSNPKLKGINDFKDGFGGELVKEYNSTSLLLCALKFSRRILFVK